MLIAFFFCPENHFLEAVIFSFPACPQYWKKVTVVTFSRSYTRLFRGWTEYGTLL